jgi:hypothetical protein
MKKAYINPEINVVIMQTRGMLAGSPPPVDGKYGSGDSVDAAGFDFDEDEEDY